MPPGYSIKKRIGCTVPILLDQIGIFIRKKNKKEFCNTYTPQEALNYIKAVWDFAEGEAMESRSLEIKCGK